MSQIQINHVSFAYGQKEIFKDVSFELDTNWKIGLIGRNGKGKTTFLKLLLGTEKYQGSITKSVEVDYFPFAIKEENDLTIQIIQEIVPDLEEWQLKRELNLLQTEWEIVYMPYAQLSGGEQIKVLLAALFLKENHFLLIDEPTNHLDRNTKKQVAQYLKNKKGFLLVSHDRELLDSTVDHILAINNTNIEIQKGTFTSWAENKNKKEHFEMVRNENLKKEIKQLEGAASRTSQWSDKIEKSKIGDGHVDKGYIGHQAARMMQRSKAIEKRIEKQVEEKKSLLQDVDKKEALTIKPLIFDKKILIEAHGISLNYENRNIFEKVDFVLERGDRLAICGKNGSGKSSILKAAMGQNIPILGTWKVANNLKISYVSQSTKELEGSLSKLAQESQIEEGIFKAMLMKLGFTKDELEKQIQNLSEGQKKKVLLAKSITESAHLYIWDEPLNFIDILSRIQIEEAIIQYKPTMLLVEHDDVFIKNVATKLCYL